MGNSKLNQPIHYGQSVVEADFSAMDFSTCPSFDEDAPCELGCRAGWLPADDYWFRCICNPAAPEEIAA